MSQVILILLVFSWIFTFYLGFSGKDAYIMVSVPFTIGLLFSYVIIRSARDQIKGINNIELLKLFPRFLRQIPPMTAAFIASLFNLILIVISGSDFHTYSGLSMGIILASGFLLEGISKYREFMSKLETRRI